MGVLRFSKCSSFYSIKGVYEFNLPAGHSCPYAVDCLSKVDRETGKQMLPKNKFRCYASVVERYPAVRNQRWSNFEAVRKMSGGELVSTLLDSIPEKAERIRIHGGGDFFSQDYFDAWLKVARARPDIIMWAFTKSVGFWVKRINEIPFNLTLQASWGGQFDVLIKRYSLKSAKVFKSAEDVGDLPIDTDDTLAMTGSRSFALLDNFSVPKKAKKGQ